MGPVIAIPGLEQVEALSVGTFCVASMLASAPASWEPLLDPEPLPDPEPLELELLVAPELLELRPPLELEPLLDVLPLPEPDPELVVSPLASVVLLELSELHPAKAENATAMAAPPPMKILETIDR
jgi:hypothetical protein